MWVKPQLQAEIKAAIEALRELEEKSFGPRHGKTDFYDYLEGVWRLHSLWRADGKSKERARQVASIYGLKLRKNTHPIRVIIDASSEQDREVKSRWTRALEFARKHRSKVAKVGFAHFLESNGGVDGCARLLAQTHPKKAKVITRAAA
jgi:ribonuclease HI